jgi:hypothetical protein
MTRVVSTQDMDLHGGDNQQCIPITHEGIS